MIRHEYRVTRDGYRPSGRPIPGGVTVRPPRPSDRRTLADLMMDAYPGTIDHRGGTPDQALEEIDLYLAQEAMLEPSRLALRNGVAQCAVLASRFDEAVLIGWVMTRREVKNQGLASALLDLTLDAIWEAGCAEVRAWITRGNHPSEALFGRAGFQLIGTIGIDD